MQLLRKEFENGAVGYYEGQRLVKHVHNACEKYYEGESGSEHLVKARLGPGDTQTIFFHGLRGHEKKIRIEYDVPRYVKHFAGDRGSERKVKEVFKNGTIHLFEGEGGCEHLVQENLASGIVLYSVGNRGMERVIKVIYPEGDVMHFVGEQGSERLVKEERTLSGNVMFFSGERGDEHVIRQQFANGDVAHYENDILVWTDVAAKETRLQKQEEDTVQALRALNNCGHCNEYANKRMQMRIRDFTHQNINCSSQYAMEELCQLNEDGHCNEHALNQIAVCIMQLRVTMRRNV